jgi:hypothetical protein
VGKSGYCGHKLAAKWLFLSCREVFEQNILPLDLPATSQKSGSESNFLSNASTFQADNHKELLLR